MSLLLVVLTLLGDPSIQLENGTFKVIGWEGVSTLRLDSAASLFSIYVDSAAGIPPLLGTYAVGNGALTFTPRFPLEPGVRYRAEFKATPAPIVATFDIPKVHTESTTVVEHIYPSRNRLPENQLKFYLHFSAPMSRGEAYQRVHILDQAGKPMSLAFLELDEELWDAENRRLTIFFDPGRIKSGLVPNNELGVPLENGKSYTLVVDRAWSDGDGIPLKEEFRKAFTVGPADREAPNPATWKVTGPKAGSRDPVSVEFPEPLDEALLERLLEVVRGDARISGSVRIDREETRWQFVPRDPWQAGAYTVLVGTELEDLAGNGLDRPFEVDVFEKVTERLSTEKVRLRFTVR
jgi:hypothetical protein